MLLCGGNKTFFFFFSLQFLYKTIDTVCVYTSIGKQTNKQKTTFSWYNLHKTPYVLSWAQNYGSLNKIDIYSLFNK